MPAFDLCEYAFYLNISYIPGAVFTFNPPATIGPSVLAILTAIGLVIFTFVFLKHPKNVRFS